MRIFFSACDPKHCNSVQNSLSSQKASPVGEAFSFLFSAKRRNDLRVYLLRLPPEPFRQRLGVGLIGHHQIQRHQAIHIVPQPQLHGERPVFARRHTSLHLLPSHRRLVPSCNMPIRQLSYGVWQAALADTAVSSSLFRDDVLSVFCDAQMLCLHQVTQTLRIIKVVDALVAHGHVLQVGSVHRLRQPRHNVQDQELDLQLVLNERDTHIVHLLFWYYTQFFPACKAKPREKKQGTAIAVPCSASQWHAQ